MVCDDFCDGADNCLVKAKLHPNIFSLLHPSLTHSLTQPQSHSAGCNDQASFPSPTTPKVALLMMASLLVLLVAAVVHNSTPTPKLAPFRFANMHGDGMVLQSAPRAAAVWGFLPASVPVHATESTGGTLEPFSTHADEVVVMVSLDGGATIVANIRLQPCGNWTWTAVLPPTLASFTNHTITATLSVRATRRKQDAITPTNTSIRLVAVVFGEVWVCSGQSGERVNASTSS